MSKKYFDEMLPYAKKASGELGIPVSVILSQWAHESAYGTSWGATHRNNHAGISNFIGKPYKWSKAYKVEKRPSNEGSWYNVYRSVDDFVSDYIHVMKLGYYKDVIRAGGTEGIGDDFIELGKSPFAGTHYKKNGVFGGSLKAIYDQFGLGKYDGISTGSIENQTMTSTQVADNIKSDINTYSDLGVSNAVLVGVLMAIVVSLAID